MEKWRPLTQSLSWRKPVDQRAWGLQARDCGLLQYNPATCMSLRYVWHLCNLPCVSVLFWLISIARYVFKSPSICFWGTKYDVYCERVAYLPSKLWRRARLWLELFASTVGRFLSRVSYLPSYVFLRRRRSFTSRKLYACLEKFLCFLQLFYRAYVSGARCIGLFLLWSFRYHRIQI